MITRITILFSVAILMMILAINMVMATHLTVNMAFDMDLVRSQHEQDLRSAVMSACIYGTKYKNDGPGPKYWDENSPMFYCEAHMQEFMQNDYPSRVMRLGRKRGKR